MRTVSGKVAGPYAVTEKDAAVFIGVSVKTLQTWRSRRMGPAYVRIAPKCIRYRMADLEAFVDSHLVKIDELANYPGC